MNFNKEKFAKRLKEARLEAGYLKQSDLAKAAGLAVQTVNYYELAKRLPDAETIFKLSRILDCTADWLVGLSDNRNYADACIGQEFHLSDSAIETLRIYSIFLSPLFESILADENMGELTGLIFQYKILAELKDADQIPLNINVVNSIEYEQQLTKSAMENKVILSADAATEYFLSRVIGEVSERIKKNLVYQFNPTPIDWEKVTQDKLTEFLHGKSEQTEES